MRCVETAAGGEMNEFECWLDILEGRDCLGDPLIEPSEDMNWMKVGWGQW
jgi:hypothetical protein